MSKQKEKQDPLLYINQPSFHVSKGKMQESFSMKEAERRKVLLVKQKEAEKKIETEKEEKKKGENLGFSEELREGDGIFGSTKKEEEVPLTSEQVQKKIEEYDEDQKMSKKEQEEHSYGSSFRRVKSFKEMSIDEKLDYLKNFPKQLPPVPCLFQTENKALRGILIGRNEKDAEIRLFDKTEATIPVKELIEVRMIGLL